MKRVAIITDGWRKYSNYAWIEGCRRYAKKTQMDVEFYVFHSFGNFSKDEKFNLGQYSIFEMFDFNDFDGAIIEITNMSDKTARAKLIERARNAKIPVLSLVEDIHGLYFAGLDNYNDLKKLVVHLIEKHGCKKMFYIGGPIDNDENQKRFQAYKDCLEEYGLHYEEEYAYQKDYEIETGEVAFRHYLERKELPEAFVCANDSIAVGICHEAKKHGYDVPKDFLVTGFDNSDRANIYSPTITTIGIEREQIAAQAMAFIQEIWNGKNTQRQKFPVEECRFQESCGCMQQQCVNLREFMVKAIFDEVNANSLQNVMLEFKRQLVECDSFEELRDAFKDCLPVLQCENVYVFLNRKLLDLSIDLEQNFVEFEAEIDEKLNKQEMDILLAYEKGSIVDNEKKETPKNDKYCPFEQSERMVGDVFLHVPLHFREVQVGYMVFKNADHILEQELIFDMLATFHDTLENVCSKMMLRKLNRKLVSLYMRDSLTGAYNRAAYKPIMESCFEEHQKKNEPIVVMFSDVDCLKHINDNHGHDMGDVAIMAVAKALHECCHKEDIIMRYGGDEFVILCPHSSKEDADNKKKRIESYLATSALNQRTDFEITTSIGYIIVEDYEYTLEEYIRMADEKMYENKNANKMRRK